ncbi:MAG: N4-gp56 family major capsid protein, partial [Candidatus Bathyarchaeota archaeon]
MSAPDVTTSALADSMQTYYDRLFLTVAKKRIVMTQFAQQRNLPKNSGKYMQFVRYSPFTPATTALTEITNPTGETMVDTAVNCYVYEYGDWAKISSLVAMTSIDPDISGKTELFAQQAAETIDRLIMTELGTGLTIQRAGAVSTLTDFAASDVLKTGELTKAVRTLKINKTTPMKDGYFVCVVDPYQAYDLMKTDSAFILAKEYAGSTELYNGELGKWMGIRIVESTESYCTAASIAATEDYTTPGAVHYAPVIGANAYG